MSSGLTQLTNAGCSFTVDWELATALELSKGLCGVRMRETYGRTPEVLRRLGAPIAEWHTVKGDQFAAIRVRFDARPFAALRSPT